MASIKASQKKTSFEREDQVGESGLGLHLPV